MGTSLGAQGRRTGPLGETQAQQGSNATCGEIVPKYVSDLGDEIALAPAVTVATEPPALRAGQLKANQPAIEVAEGEHAIAGHGRHIECGTQREQVSGSLRDYAGSRLGNDTCENTRVRLLQLKRLRHYSPFSYFRPHWGLTLI